MKIMIMSMTERSSTQKCELSSNIEFLIRSINESSVETVAIPTTEWGLDLVQTIIATESLPKEIILYGSDLKTRLVQFFELKLAYEILEKDGVITINDKNLDDLLQELKCK